MAELLVTHLEMTEPPSFPPRRPRGDVQIAREHLDNRAYLALYRAVGGPVQWDERLRISAEQLERLLAQSSTHVHVLRLVDAAIGFCEFNRVGEPDVVLSHFGIVPEVQGRGLGSFLLSSALAACWEAKPRRIWLKTDTNDHPSAVTTYEKAGFRTYLKQVESFPD